MIEANQLRNAIPTGDGQPSGSLFPMSCRSLILSALLGTDPPALPLPALLAFVGLFGRPAGTARTALSRMATAGEVEVADGWYSLGGRLLERKKHQDQARPVLSDLWDGNWITVIAASDQRSMSDRRAFRASMLADRFGELRPDIWLRPNNTSQPQLGADAIVLVGPIAGPQPLDLVHRLWPLEAISKRAGTLLDQVEARQPLVAKNIVKAVPGAFLLSAEVVRFLRTEPQLPPELQPNHWLSDDLRAQYNKFEAALQTTLKQFFAQAISAPSS